MEIKIFFTADLHLYHANIIKYCKRPFKNVDEMHEEIIKRWNAVVPHGSEVYVLGDIAFTKNSEEPITILTQLNGLKHLIKGNHDKRLSQRTLSCFSSVRDYSKIKIFQTGQEIILMHYSMRTWDKAHHGTWHLYGHSHGSLPEDPYSRSFDVGVDANNFTPVSYAEVSERMGKKLFKPIDHHTEK